MLKMFIRSNRPFNYLTFAILVLGTLGPIHYSFVTKPWIPWDPTVREWQVAMLLGVVVDLALYTWYYPWINTVTKRLVLFLRYLTGNKHINRKDRRNP